MDVFQNEIVILNEVSKMSSIYDDDYWMGISAAPCESCKRYGVDCTGDWYNNGICFVEKSNNDKEEK